MTPASQGILPATKNSEPRWKYCRGTSSHALPGNSKASRAQLCPVMAGPESHTLLIKHCGWIMGVNVAAVKGDLPKVGSFAVAGLPNPPGLLGDSSGLLIGNQFIYICLLVSSPSTVSQGPIGNRARWTEQLPVGA
jgi:hypothetical protein